MKRPLKFDLPINGTAVRDLEALRSNFTIDVLELHVQGILLAWVKQLGEPVLEAKLATIAAQRCEEVLLALAAALGAQASPAMLHAAGGKPLPPLSAAESAVKYQYDGLADIIEALKRKRYLLTQPEYDALAKQMIDVACGEETCCVLFDDALFEKIVPTGRYSTFTGNFLHPKARVAQDAGMRFRFAKNKGDLVAAAEAVGRVYPDDLGVGIWVHSPVSGVLVEFGETERIGDAPFYRLDRPLFYVQPRAVDELRLTASRTGSFFGLFRERVAKPPSTD